MQSWKCLLLSTYFNVTLPVRRQAAALRAKLGVEPVSILFYHRVADAHPNDWTMPCKTFAKQIDWIERHFDIISLEEAQRRIGSGVNSRPSVALTFDDGYTDNCEFALPLLLRKNLPFTYFVTSHNVIDGTPFPHDSAAGVPLRPNSIAELRSLAQAGVEIGAHTRTHPDLGPITDRQQLEEQIIGSRTDLKNALGCDVRYFAFPYGLHENMNQLAFQIAYEAGFKGVCSAYGAYNQPGDDPFNLQRIHADVELVRVKNWLSVDPRKTVIEPFDPGDYQLNVDRQIESSTATIIQTGDLQ